MKTRVSVFAKCVCMAILGFITAVPAQAGLIHNVNITPDSEYIDYGLNFPWVVPIGVQSNGTWAFGGSGVVIAPGAVLFSAHQTYADGDNSDPFDGYAVRFTSNFVTDPAVRFEAYDMVRHPDYVGSRSGPDLALMFFEDLAPFSAIPEVALYSGEHTVGTAYHIAGFGIFGTPSTGLEGYTGDRRAGTNLLTSDSAFGGQFLQARFSHPSASEFQELGILGTPGDSGGGWFIDVGGDIQLAAISSLWTGSASYGSSTFATPFSAETLAWIDREIQLHTTAVPEPSSLLMMLIGSGIATPFLRRTRQGSPATSHDAKQ